MNDKVLVLYHSNCLDGVAAAWVVSSYYDNNVELVAVQYQQDPPDVTGRDVVIVDFSYKRPVLEEMKQKAKSLEVIDHHKTAQEDLDGLEYCHFDMKKSGCGLAWECFYPGEPMPKLLQHIQDRDLWQFNLDQTREINLALFTYPVTVETIEMFISDPDGSQKLISEGITLQRGHDKTVALLCSKPRCMSFQGYTVPVVNCNTQYSSDVGNKLAQEATFAATYCDTTEGRIFSFRSVGEFDVSEIAAFYGGGGHRNAAGAKISYDKVTMLGLM